ncbi:MAG TPA: hypothetical protein VMH01_05795 [Puia sp.]|nr:hypothetical protein [Puia sp.]
MKPDILFLLSQSIWFPVVVGLLRFKLLKTEYLLFFLLLVAGLITEIISFITIRVYHSNAVATNIFVLTEWLLLAYQFNQWGLLASRKRLFYLLLIIPVLIWIVENLFLGKITAFSPYFRILYAFLLTLMSITEINFMIAYDNKTLRRNPKFIICIGLILFFVYQILYEWAYQVSLIQEPTHFTTLISSLFAYINALTNIIFGIAFLVIPGRTRFKLE